MLKFISKALVAVLLNKDARKKLKDRSLSKKTKASKKKFPVKKTTTSKAPAIDTLVDNTQVIMDALPEARQMITAPSQNLEPPEPTKLERKLFQRRGGTHKTLNKALDSLSQQKKAMTPERQALIQKAVALTKMKAKVLDDLAPEQREKLKAMALATFSGQVGPPKGRK